MYFGDAHYVDHESGKKLRLPFPGKLFIGGVKQLEFDANKLTTENIKQLFILFVGNWLEGSTSTEDLSSISNYFLSIIKGEDDELFARLIDASELTYYIRHTRHESGEPLHGFVTRLREYHKSSPDF